ncbi:MAG: hypothetical protein JO163_00990 [Methylobacteriaceae bacterium]|nr:hypothetical protein [Methylobacteriaceae bacterium]MBV9635189.1 hypothetical protein [Methylobacteriaceae bacterium]MBV9701279.1 hypothetical protein [Methylobacteriaceae bacterium]
MLTLRPALVTAAMLWVALAPHPVQAQISDGSQNPLVQLYKLSVAIDVCSDVDLSADEEEKLDKAISSIEAKLALTEEASEDLYTRLSALADNDKDTFCKAIVPTLKEAIAKLPN